MKYKVGDKVKVKKNLIVGEMYGGCFFMVEMKECVDKEAVIDEVEEGCYYLDIDDEYFGWTDEMLEPVGLPEKWYIIITKENREDVQSWWNHYELIGCRAWTLGSGYGWGGVGVQAKAESALNELQGEEITFEQFKNYILKEEGKKLAGYKIIKEFPTTDERLKKGFVMYATKFGEKGWGNMPEIASKYPEFWEPVYEKVEKVLKFGNVECTIKSNKGADTDHGFIPVEDIKKALHYIDNPPKLAGFELNQRFSKDSFGYQKVKFGCEEGRIGDFRQILIEIENYGK